MVYAPPAEVLGKGGEHGSCEDHRAGRELSSSDDAVQQALAEARKTLRNIKAVDVVSTGLRGGGLDEWRAHVRVAFLVESVD
jgi:flavin-binding protein dodecin